ncbi:MAG: cytochrome P450 [Actinobacteria bacterium]|nr:MAG: cytochrome P450 [Actinomycetota bacterium]
MLLDMIQANIEMPPGTLIHESDPSHTIHRQLLSRVFTPKAMAAIEPQVREFCASRLDELVGRDSFDFVTDFAEYVPMRVFGMLLGIPEEDQQRVLEYTEIGMNSEPGKPKVYDDEDFMSGEFYGEFVDERYENPRDDVITRLIMAEFDDEHGVRGTLTREEALTYLSVLAGAGNHTTNRLISWTAKVLADNPDARRELLENPALIPNAIEETLRFEPSSTQIARYVARDVEIHGQTVPEGNAMLCLAGSASRDERVFDEKAMAAIEPQVREFCASRLDELVGRDSFDFVTDFAEYVPMRVFGMLLGIPEEDQQRVLEYTEIGMNSEPGKPKVYDDEDFMSGEFYGEFVDERYENPRDDVITRLIMAEFDDEHGVRGTLTREEALTYLSVLAGAGNHTTNRLISWTAKVLADNPDARRELLENPALIPNAIEETLRFEPSSTQIARYVARDVEIHGQTVPEGNAMLCLAGSASRDERVFEDPDRFDIHRKIGHQLTFGYGAHFCLGASLARLEGRVALEEVLKRFPEWELDRENCVLGTAPGVRGYASLPVFIP